MDASEMKRYLDGLCADLDAGRTPPAWARWARRLALPAAFGLSVALGACDNGSTSTPVYAAIDVGIVHDGLAPQDGAAYAAIDVGVVRDAGAPSEVGSVDAAGDVGTPDGHPADGGGVG
jgi:hypothetical protein